MLGNPGCRRQSRQELEWNPSPNSRNSCESRSKSNADGERSWTPTTEEHFMYFLGVVPPALMRGHVFACGEPWRHNEHRQPVYLCFRREQGGPYYEARYASVKELVAEVFPKPEPDDPAHRLKWSMETIANAGLSRCSKVGLQLGVEDALCAMGFPS